MFGICVSRGLRTLHRHNIFYTVQTVLSMSLPLTYPKTYHRKLCDFQKKKKQFVSHLCPHKPYKPVHTHTHTHTHTYTNTNTDKATFVCSS